MRTALLALAVLVAPAAAAAQTGPPERLAPTTDPAAFGGDVAVSPTRAAVGAPLLQATGRDAGALYVYERASPDAPWAEAARLTVEADDVRLGSSVALLDGAVVAGAVGGEAFAGAVFVARPSADGWALAERIDAPAPGVRFGDAVDAGGDRVAVGAPELPGAFVYHHDGEAWAVEASLPGETGDRTGAALALDGDALAVAAPERRVDGVSDAGAVEVWRRGADGWAREATLSAPTPTRRGFFGTSVALNGDRLLIGARGEDDDQGAVYVAERDEGGAWAIGDRLVAPVRQAQQMFGWAVALEGDRAAASAMNDPGAGAHAGRVWVLDRGEGGTWAPSAELAPPGEDVANDNFGTSLAIAGESVLVGSPGEGPTVEAHGAAYGYAVARPTALAAGPAPLAAVVAPNPTAGAAALVVGLDAPARVRVVVVDALGREVARAALALGAGRHRVPLGLGGAPAGVYHWRVEGAAGSASGRVTVVR